MTRRRKLLLSIAALALGLVALLLIRNREPRYQGRTISEWADIGLKATDSVPWDEPNVLMASNALRRIGMPALGVRFSSDVYRKDTRLLAACLAEKLGGPGEEIVAWLKARAHQDADALLDRSAFIAYSLATDTNVFLPRLLDDEWLNATVVTAALDGSLAPKLVDVFLSQTNPAGNNARMVLTYMGSKAASADPILRPFVGTSRGHPNWEAAIRIVAQVGHRQEDTANMVLTDAELPANKKLEILALMGEQGTRATAGFLTDTNPAVRGQALLHLLLQTERLQSWERACKPTFRIDQFGGWPPPLVFPSGWRPPGEVMRVLQRTSPEAQLSAITTAVALMGWGDATLEEAAFRYNGIDAGYRRRAIRAFVAELAKSPVPKIAAAASDALAGLTHQNGAGEGRER